MTIKEQVRRCSMLSDDELWSGMPRLARKEREDVAAFLIHLLEIKRRQLHIQRAYSGLFTYLVKLGYSEWDAHARSVAVDTAQKYPSVLGLLGTGRLTLSALEALASVLTSANHRVLLRKACRRSRREVEKLVAGLAPQAAPRDSFRVVSAPPPIEPPPGAPQAPATAPTSNPLPGSESDLFGAQVEPAAPPPAAELYAITFTATKETHDLLRRAKEVLRHRFPKAGTDEIVNFALKRVLAELDRDLKRPAKPAGPARDDAKRSRYIPEAVKQAAWERDGGQCAFVAADGTRCTARAWLEFDHATPYALGGDSRDPKGIRPYCFPHNQWAAEQAFGAPEDEA